MSDDHTTAARDNFLSRLCLYVGGIMFVLLLFTGHPLAGAGAAGFALLGLLFFVDYLRIDRRLNRQEGVNGSRFGWWDRIRRFVL